MAFCMLHESAYKNTLNFPEEVYMPLSAQLKSRGFSEMEKPIL